MDSPIIIKLCVLSLVLGAAGCSVNKPKTRFVDEHFNYAPIIVILHHQIYANYELKDGESKTAAIHDLLSYLKNDHPVLQSKLSDLDFSLIKQTQVRSRDYWALVLSNMAGEELSLIESDTFKQRDLKINAFVAKVSNKYP